MRHRLYYHIVWTTIQRAPMIDADLAVSLHAHMRRVSIEERAELLSIGIVSTHLHLLIQAHPMCNLSRLLQRLKGGSSHGRRKLRWEKGYNIESVSVRALPQVKSYLESQPLHHPDEAISGWPPPL